MCSLCHRRRKQNNNIYIRLGDCGWLSISKVKKSDQQRDDSLVGKKVKNDVPGVDAPKPVPNNVL